MTTDILKLFREEPTKDQPDSWLADNVFKPFANGTGVIQVYDTIVDKPVSTYQVPEAKTFSVDWCAQTLSGAAGAIVPYVVAGKLTGVGMRAVGEGLELQGGAARLMASQSTAQILGAGLYEYAQKPAVNQTRLGNAAGTMAGFAVFAGGEMALGKAGSTLASPLERAVARGTSRVAIGAAGGLGSYETSNQVSSLLGAKHTESWDERFKAMAQGGFVNLALPVVQEGASRVMDRTFYSQPGSKGLPIQRDIKYAGYSDPELTGLVHDNALARVKRGAETEAQADVTGNRVLLNKGDGAPRLAHEMTHLKLARSAEPVYKQLAELAKENPVEAEQAYYALRAEMEMSARRVENRVENRVDEKSGATVKATATGTHDDIANWTLPVVADAAVLGHEHAGAGKTYADVWQAEWQQFKANPDYRPPVEYGGIVKWTEKYENWMKDKIQTIPEDLAKKHADMASDPFKFLRATYYRWAKMFPKICPEEAGAPRVKSVGDLHIDNFGTWMDRLKRMIWGVNDFDESYKLPYTNDLVRLMTSANLARGQSRLKISLKEACETVLEGYKQGLEDGGEPFVLTGKNTRLARIARSQMADGPKYWEKLANQLSGKRESSIPDGALDAVNSILPEGHGKVAWGHRQAGEGSLGRQRYVGMTEAGDHNFAGEAKALLPSANYFAQGKPGGRSHYDGTVNSAVRIPDPYVRTSGDWIVRRLGPEHTKIELESLPKLKDEKLLLWSMGYETANIHLGTKNAADLILPDLAARSDNWLVNAVKDMTESTLKDHKKWREHMRDRVKEGEE